MIRLKQVLPALMVVGSLMGAAQVMAEEAPAPGTAMQGAAVPGSAAHASHHAKAEGVDAHIAKLRKALGVTAAQEEQWKPVADAIRENAKTLSDLHTDKLTKVATQTAIEDLAAYREIAEAHFIGAKHLEEAFSTFYATLSAEQKKVADDVFRQHKSQSGHHHG